MDELDFRRPPLGVEGRNGRAVDGVDAGARDEPHGTPRDDADDDHDDDGDDESPLGRLRHDFLPQRGCEFTVLRGLPRPQTIISHAVGCVKLACGVSQTTQRQ
jgi:hypothetical protein